MASFSAQLRCHPCFPFIWKASGVKKADFLIFEKEHANCMAELDEISEDFDDMTGQWICLKVRSGSQDAVTPHTYVEAPEKYRAGFKLAYQRQLKDSDFKECIKSMHEKARKLLEQRGTSTR